MWTAASFESTSGSCSRERFHGFLSYYLPSIEPGKVALDVYREVENSTNCLSWTDENVRRGVEAGQCRIWYFALWAKIAAGSPILTSIKRIRRFIGGRWAFDGLTRTRSAAARGDASRSRLQHASQDRRVNITPGSRRLHRLVRLQICGALEMPRGATLQAQRLSPRRASARRRRGGAVRRPLLAGQAVGEALVPRERLACVQRRSS